MSDPIKSSAEIKTKRRQLDANRQLIERMEKKITATLARIWGDPEPPQTP